MFSGRPSVRPSVVRQLTTVSRDVISPYYLEGSSNFSETCHKYSSCQLALLKRYFKVRGQRSRPMTYNVRGTHFDGVALRLACSPLSKMLTVSGERFDRCLLTLLSGLSYLKSHSLQNVFL